MTNYDSKAWDFRILDSTCSFRLKAPSSMPDRFCPSKDVLFVTCKYVKMTDWIHLLYHLTLFWILSDIFLHRVLEVNSSNSTIPESRPWCEPWNASQLITEAPLEPLPASRTQASKPDVDTDFTQTDAGSWILTCSLPWLSVTNTFTSPEPWNWVLKETVRQPWLFWDVSEILIFPVWKTSAWIPYMQKNTKK